MTVLFLLRHGLTYANKLNLLQGTLENSTTFLTPQSKVEIIKLKKLLSRYQIDLVYTSPLNRAFDTTEIICDNRTPFTIDQRLRELSYGKWNGQSWSYLIDNYCKYVNLKTQEVSSSSMSISQGESFEQGQQRIKSFVNEISFRFPNNRVLLVTHGWIIKNFIAIYWNNNCKSAHFNPKNLSLTKFLIDRKQNNFKLMFYDRLFL